MHQWWLWWLGLSLLWKFFSLVFVVLPLPLLKWLWTKIHIKPVLKLVFSIFFPTPHTPKPDLVVLGVVWSSTPTSIKFEWGRQVIHLWGRESAIDWIWERFTSPRNIVVQGGTKEFVGLLPGSHLCALPAICAKTGIIEWTQAVPSVQGEFPYPDYVNAYSVSGGGSMHPKTRVRW